MAKEEGMAREEIGAVQSIVMAVSDGRVRAQFREVAFKDPDERKMMGSPPSGGIGEAR